MIDYQSDPVSGSGSVGGLLSTEVPCAGWPSGPISPGQAGSRVQSWTAVPPTVKGTNGDWEGGRVCGSIPMRYCREYLVVDQTFTVVSDM